MYISCDLRRLCHFHGIGVLDLPGTNQSNPPLFWGLYQQKNPKLPGKSESVDKDEYVRKKEKQGIITVNCNMVKTYMYRNLHSITLELFITREVFYNPNTWI